MATREVDHAVIEELYTGYSSYEEAMASLAEQNRDMEYHTWLAYARAIMDHYEDKLYPSGTPTSEQNSLLASLRRETYRAAYGDSWQPSRRAAAPSSKAYAEMQRAREKARAQAPTPVPPKSKAAGSTPVDLFGAARPIPPHPPQPASAPRDEEGEDGRELK